MKELLYAIVNQDSYLLESEANKIIKALNVDAFNVLTYDFDHQELDEFYVEIMTISFLSDNKVIKVKNPWFFYEERNDHDLETLIKYFRNPKDDTTIIFLLEKDIDSSLKISKEAKKYVRFEFIKDIDKEELPTYITNIFFEDGYSIEHSAIETLIERTSGDFQTIVNEIKKIKLYAYNNKKVSNKDVELLVPRNLEDNIFELSTAVVKKNKSKALEMYYDLLTKNIDPVSIIGNLATKIKETITTKHLLEQKMSQQSIADYFNASYGRAYYMILNAKEIDLNTLTKYYDSLADLDYKIKSGQIDKQLGLELWLLEGLDVK